MKRRVTLLLAAAAVVMGSLSGTAGAGWRDEVELSATVEVGYVHYAVGDPAIPLGPLQDEATFTDTDGDPGWELPDAMLLDLTPQAPQTAVVQIDGYTQGNRGLAYWLDGVEVEGDDALLDLANLRIAQVDTPSLCVAGTLDAATPLYDGAASGASFENRELVSPGHFAGSTESSWEDDSRTHYLCLELSLPDLTYENTARASAVVPGSEHYEVTDSDTWSAIVEPAQAQRAATLTLRLPYETYRAGGEADRALLAVEIVQTGPQPPYFEGARLTFEYRVTNLTDATRATQVLESNLTGDAGCRWTTHASGSTMACSTPHHVVTQGDLDAGSFTPTATWGIHSGTSYPGVVSRVGVTGEPVRLSTP